MNLWSVGLSPIVCAELAVAAIVAGVGDLSPRPPHVLDIYCWCMPAVYIVSSDSLAIGHHNAPWPGVREPPI